MKRRILSLFIIIACLTYANGQACIDTIQNLLTLLDKSQSNGSDCSFSVKFCVRKTNADADHISYGVYTTGGIMTKVVDISGVPVDSVFCEVFNFIADCNSSATFIAVGEEINNSTCGFVTDFIILPIRLLSFSGDIKQPGIFNLNWQTVSESNSSHFILQQSKDGKKFLDVAKIKAVGESNTLQNYDYEYKSNITTGVSLAYYFRLKLVDKDDSYNYSPIISIGKTEAHKLIVYPNPSSAKLHFDKIDLQKENVQMINLQGQEIALIWSNDNTLDLQNVLPGIYFLKYQDEVIRFIKQ